MNFTKEAKNLCKSVQSVFHFKTCGYTLAPKKRGARFDEFVPNIYKSHRDMTVAFFV
jgi:hypothetical protein